MANKLVDKYDIATNRRHREPMTASEVVVNTDYFEGNLLPTDTDLQRVCDRVDSLVIPGMDEMDKYYIHLQDTPSTVWHIVHNLGKKPAVEVLDSTSRIVLGGYIDYLNDNELTINFSLVFAGKAICN